MVYRHYLLLDPIPLFVSFRINICSNHEVLYLQFLLRFFTWNKTDDSRFVHRCREKHNTAYSFISCTTVITQGNPPVQQVANPILLYLGIHPSSFPSISSLKSLLYLLPHFARKIINNVQLLRMNGRQLVCA